MNKAESYCYVIRKHLKNRRLRVCLYYSNQHPNSKERIEVKRTDDLNTDLQNLLSKVREELPKYTRIKLENEKESVVYNATRTTIEKYFICIQ